VRAASLLLAVAGVLLLVAMAVGARASHRSSKTNSNTKEKP
jgi:hypothetical protein